MNAIEISNLTKSYGKARGINGIDLTVRQGEFFGFIGPNGAGKSTTIRTLLGLINPNSGTANILGYDITQNKKDILARTGYLPAEMAMYSGMKVRDVIRLSADLYQGAGFPKKTYLANAAVLCERMQLDTARKVDELSFGNRKKTAIVCALSHEPALLILDEPTTGLDPLMQKEFFDILHERNTAGTTIFLSSHILSEIQRNCTRAAIIREGRIIACDSVDALARANAKRVTIHEKVGMDDPHQDLFPALHALSGVRDLHASGPAASSQSISFLYSGNINELIRLLSQRNISDLSIAEPDLEEIFIHYYENEGGVSNDACEA